MYFVRLCIGYKEEVFRSHNKKQHLISLSVLIFWCTSGWSVDNETDMNGSRGAVAQWIVPSQWRLRPLMSNCWRHCESACVPFHTLLEKWRLQRRNKRKLRKITMKEVMNRLVSVSIEYYWLRSLLLKLISHWTKFWRESSSGTCCRHGTSCFCVLCFDHFLALCGLESFRFLSSFVSRSDICRCVHNIKHERNFGGRPTFGTPHWDCGRQMVQL